MPVTGINAATMPAGPPQLNNDRWLLDGAQRHPVPLGAPDVALRGQRLLAYGERLRREGAGIDAAEPDRDRRAARPHQPPVARQIREVAQNDNHPCYLWLIRQKTSGKLFTQSSRIYREPRGAPEIGRRPLDLGIPH